MDARPHELADPEQFRLEKILADIDPLEEATERWRTACEMAADAGVAIPEDLAAEAEDALALIEAGEGTGFDTDGTLHWSSEQVEQLVRDPAAFAAERQFQDRVGRRMRRWKERHPAPVAPRDPNTPGWREAWLRRFAWADRYERALEDAPRRVVRDLTRPRRCYPRGSRSARPRPRARAGRSHRARAPARPSDGEPDPLTRKRR